MDCIQSVSLAANYYVTCANWQHISDSSHFSDIPHVEYSYIIHGDFTDNHSARLTTPHRIWIMISHSFSRYALLSHCARIAQLSFCLHTYPCRRLAFNPRKIASSCWCCISLLCLCSLYPLRWYAPQKSQSLIFCFTYHGEKPLAAGSWYAWGWPPQLCRLKKYFVWFAKFLA